MFENDGKTTKTESSTSSSSGVCEICRESLDALNLRTAREALSTSKSWNSVSCGSEASTPALTDCSSRSSLTDLLDLSIDQDDYGFHDFKDPPTTPTGQPYLAPLSSPGKVRNQSLAYLPSVLGQQSPQSRSVSFSGIEEIFGDGSDEIEHESDTKGGLVYPTTPIHQWYSSKDSDKLHQHPQRLAYAPVATKPRRKPQLQPRRSALKKPDDSQLNSGLTRLEYPVSPKILWYAPTPKG